MALKIEYRIIGDQQITTFSPHILIIGKTGSGKSNAAEYIVTQRVGRNKVIDLYDDGRFENICYQYKENDPYLLKKMKEIKGVGPKSWPVDYYLFAGSRVGYLRKRIPKCVKIVSINQKDLKVDDLFYLLGTTQPAKNFIAQLAVDYGNVSMTKIYNLLAAEDSKGKAQMKGLGTMRYSILRNVKRWMNSPLFDNETYPPIDFKEFLGHPERISSMSTYLCDSDEDKAAVYGIMCKKILNAKRYGFIKKPVTLYIREISNFMGRGGLSTNFTLAQNNILKIIREGRDLGLSLVADGQRALDLDTHFRRQFGVIVQLKSDLADAEKLLEIMDIPKRTLEKINQLGRGEAIVVTGSEYRYPVLFPPARHGHKPERVDVLRLMKEKEMRENGWSEDDYPDNDKLEDDEF